MSKDYKNILNQLEIKIELESQSITIDFDSSYPKGYLDGMLWAFDLVLLWIRELISN